MEQRTPEWFAMRAGKVTASRVADVMAKTKSGPSASRANYMAELIVERLTGEPAARFTNAAMEWGTEKEPDAIAAYEFMHDATVSPAGFVLHPDSLETGASPDGFVGDDGLIEVKCPNTATHIETLLSRKVPGKYNAQMQWQMACTGRAWCDFVSYDPRLPAHLSMFVQRVERDEAFIADAWAEVSAFLSELSAKMKELQGLYPSGDEVPLPPGIEASARLLAAG
jgi:putative phage-type endonuclease